MGTFIENVDDLCRICATYKEQMLSIYNDQGAEYDLESKIKTFLPFIIVSIVIHFINLNNFFNVFHIILAN